MKAKKKASRKTSTSKRPQMKTITLTMDRRMKAVLDMIAGDASTDLSTVAQVLLATGMHMGHGGTEIALNEAAVTIGELQGKLQQCRQVMEANDPGNFRHIFGVPKETPPPEEGAPTVP